MELDQIYKLDASGNIRVWWAEVGEGENSGYWRTHSGRLNGVITISEWKYAPARSQDNAHNQALFYASAAMEKKLQVDYRTEIDNIKETRNSLVRPMLAGVYAGWQRPCFAQPKLDGIRCLANKDGLWTRNNLRIVATPHIEAELKAFFQDYPDIILDGELYNHDLHDNFNKITSLVKKTIPEFEDLEESASLIEYWIFDMFDIENPNAVFEERWDFLCDRLFNRDHNISMIVGTQTKFIKTEEELDIYNLKLLEAGYEGQIVRHNTIYEQKRTNNLLKRKDTIDEEFELLDILEGDGAWQGFAKIAVCRATNGKQFRAGISGTQDYCLDLLNEKDKYHSVTVKYQQLTPDGIPRFPIATKFYEQMFGGLEERIQPKRDLFA